MTLGIAVPFPGGSILCADTRVDAGEGATAGEGNALVSVTSGKRMFAITCAGRDARAGHMLTSEIAAVACNAASLPDIVPGIKRVMGDWFRSYGVAPVPPVQFLVATNAAEDNAGRILLCEPPSTVTETYGPCVIGSGARQIHPWLNLVGPRYNQAFSFRSTALRISWLTHLARRYEGQSGGGDTEMIVLSNRGSFTYVDRKELKMAEALGDKVDALLLDTARQVLCAEGEQSPQAIAEEFLRSYFDVMEQNPQVLFPSLSYLEKQPAPAIPMPERAHPEAAPAGRSDFGMPVKSEFGMAG